LWILPAEIIKLLTLCQGFFLLKGITHAIQDKAGFGKRMISCFQTLTGFIVLESHPGFCYACKDNCQLSFSSPACLCRVHFRDPWLIGMLLNRKGLCHARKDRFQYLRYVFCTLPCSGECIKW
jgi:hypothetical protein